MGDAFNATKGTEEREKGVTTTSNCLLKQAVSPRA